MRNIRRTGALGLRLDRSNRRNLRAAGSAILALATRITIPVEDTAATCATFAKSAHAHAVACEAWPARLKPARQTHLHIRGAATPHAASLRAPFVADAALLAASRDEPLGCLPRIHPASIL